MIKVPPDIFEHDIGTRFQAQIRNLVNSESPEVFDISTATEKLIIFKKPNGVEVEYPGTFVTNGVDGLLEYVTATSDDLLLVTTGAVVETWEYYAWVKYPGGERRTSPVTFKLYKGRQSQA